MRVMAGDIREPAKIVLRRFGVLLILRTDLACPDLVDFLDHVLRHF